MYTNAGPTRPFTETDHGFPIVLNHLHRTWSLCRMHVVFIVQAKFFFFHIFAPISFALSVLKACHLLQPNARVPPKDT